MALIQDPAQRAVLDRVTAVMSLVEGTRRVRRRTASARTSSRRCAPCARFAQRRKGTGPLDRVLRRLLGLEQKMKQYAEAGSSSAG